MSGGFSVPEEDKSWYTALAARTSKAFALQVGSDIAVGGFLLVAPTCQITDVQQTSIDGIHGVDVQWKARGDEDTAQSNDLERSAFRIHLI
jgi:alkyl sulfatase BDS1-like metallo-beta-lactamase superfamily hydrolase